MNGIEEEVEEKKDHARPFFPRKPGEVGLYVDVDVATCEDQHAYGSEHLMRVEMNDKLGEQLVQRDLVKIKGELERRGHFRGVILEEFRRGTILAVIFDSVAALEELWRLHEGKQLTPMFQSILVDKAMLKGLAVRTLSLRVRMWPDELDACMQEMHEMGKNTKRVDVIRRPRDMAILHRVRQFQKDQSLKLQQLRDAEATFDKNLSEFLLVIKRALPQKTIKIPNLKEFQTNMTVAMGTHLKGMQHVKHYFSTLELLRTLLTQAEANLYLPLTLIPTCCETPNQGELKQQMKSTCVEMQRLLKPMTSLTEPHFKEWEGKVTPGERNLFMGLISLVPLGVEKVTDVDQFVDEYITDFPSFS